MRRWLLTMTLCAVAACSDDPPAPADTGAPDAPAADVATDVASDLAPDASPDVAQDATPDVAPDAGRPLPCLDRPNELLRPPTGVLPCDLIPPSF